MLLHHEYIAEPRECRAIGHDARKRNLRGAAVGVAGEGREADGSVDGPIDNIARHSDGPVRIVVKETPDQIAIDVSGLTRDDVLPHVRRV